MAGFKKGQAVLVTTDQRGVFFGYVAQDYETDHPERVVLERIRNCIYWHATIKGFLGLAAQGPNKDCRIGPPSPKASVYGITLISDVTPEAVKAWEVAPWA